MATTAPASNPFDQFDTPAPAATAANPFDQFDATAVPAPAVAPAPIGLMQRVGNAIGSMYDSAVDNTADLYAKLTPQSLPPIVMPTPAEQARSAFEFNAAKATPTQLADPTFGQGLLAAAAKTYGVDPQGVLPQPVVEPYQVGGPAAATAAFMSGAAEPVAKALSGAAFLAGGAVPLLGGSQGTQDAAFKLADTIGASGANGGEQDIARSPIAGMGGNLLGSLAMIGAAPELDIGAGAVSSNAAIRALTPYARRLAIEAPKAALAIGVPEGTAAARRVIDKGGSLSQAIAAGITQAGVSTGQFSAPLSLGGNLATRALTGEAIGLGLNSGGEAAMHAIAPDVYQPAQAPDFTNPMTYATGLLGAISPGLRGAGLDDLAMQNLMRSGATPADAGAAAADKLLQDAHVAAGTVAPKDITPPVAPVDAVHAQDATAPSATATGITAADQAAHIAAITSAYQAAGKSNDDVLATLMRAQKKADKRGNPLTLWRGTDGSLGFVPSARPGPFAGGQQVGAIYPQSQIQAPAHDGETAAQTPAAEPNVFDQFDTAQQTGSTAAPVIPDFPGLNPRQREVEARARQQVQKDPEAAIAAYDALPGTDGGRVISTDEAREIFPDYNTGPEARSANAVAVHEPASWVAKQAYQRALARPRSGENAFVLFTGGGTGAGKTTGMGRVPTMANAKRDADVVYDGNLQTADSAIKKIDQALATKRKVRVVYTFRDPVQAFVHGALPRAERANYGRTVPIPAHVSTHVGAAETYLALKQHYADNPNVTVRAIHNDYDPRAGVSSAGLLENDNFPSRLAAMDRGTLTAEVRNALESERQAGNVSDRVYHGTLGTEVPVDSRQPQGGAGRMGPVETGAEAALANGRGNDRGGSGPGDGQATEANSVTRPKTPPDGGVSASGADATSPINLEPLRSEIGWEQTGGRILREADTGGEKPEVVGRTTWEPKEGQNGEPSEFWRQRPTVGGKINEDAAKAALDKYASGQALNAKERRFVDYAIETQRRYDEAYAQQLSDYRADQRDQLDADKANEAMQDMDVGHEDVGEALTLDQLVARAYKVGVDARDIIDVTFDGTAAEQARKLWDLTRRAENRHGTDTGTIAQDHPAVAETRPSGIAAKDSAAADDAGAGARHEGSAARPGPQAGSEVGPKFSRDTRTSDMFGAAREPERAAPKPAATTGDMFGGPSARDHLGAAERAKDAQRNGLAGGNEDTGDGGLFDGARPEQAKLSRDAVSTERTPHTTDQVRDAARKGWGNRWITKLERAGVLHFLTADESVARGLAKSVDDLDGVKGLYVEGNAYVITDRVRDLADVPGLVLHEAGLHYGYHNLLTETERATLRGMVDKAMARGDPDIVRAWLKAKAARTPDGHMYEEAMAYAAEDNPGHSIIRRLLDMLKRALNRFGIPLRLLESNVEAIRRMARDMLRRAASQAESKAMAMQVDVDGAQPWRASTVRGAPVFSRDEAGSGRHTEDQTQTPSFQKWFGDSKVVDADGKPLVVYHGAVKDIAAFNRGSDSMFKYGEGDSGGIFFTSDAKAANYYTEGSHGTEPGANVVPAYIRLENPAHIGPNHGLPEQAALLRKAEADGHDGAIIGDDEYVVFRPNQIKSATGNRGTFDPSNPDIRFSRSVETKAAYDKRIDELFDGDKPHLDGVRVLDRSDVLGLVENDDAPLHLVEGKVISGKFNHALTADDWKRVPEWVENPVAVFDSDTVSGRLVAIAPELKDGAPIRMILEPHDGETEVSLLVNAYDAKGRSPLERWIDEGKLRYVNKNEARRWLSRSGLRLPGLLNPAKGSRGKVLTFGDLVKYRDEHRSSADAGIPDVRYSRDNHDALKSATYPFEDDASLFAPPEGDLDIKLPPRAPGESKSDWHARVMRGGHRQMRAAMRVARMQRDISRDMLRAMWAERARAMASAAKAFAKATAVFDSAGREANLKAIDQWENGEDVTSAAHKVFFQSMQAGFDSRIAEIRKLAPDAMQHLIEDYFPHLWKDPTKAAKWYQGISARAPLAGNKSFLKQRVYATMKEGMASGLEPVSTNPVDLVLGKVAQMDKFISMLKYRKQLDDMGWLKKMAAGERVPVGYARVDDPSFQIAAGLQGYYAVPEPIANDLNNYLGPSLYRFTGFKLLRHTQNLIVMARLGWSGFHAGFTTLDNLVTHASIAGQYLMQGDAKRFLVALAQTPASVLVSPIHGGTLNKQWLGLKDGDANTMALLYALEQGGARWKMDSTDYNNALPKFIRAIRQRDYKQGLRSTVSAVGEVGSFLIHHVLVPNQKMSARVALLKVELDRVAMTFRSHGRTDIKKGDYANIINAMSPIALRQISARVVQNVDDRLGQMTYDNQFWNKTARELGQTVIMALGWLVGSIRTVTGGVHDLPHLWDPKPLLAALDKEGKITDAHMGRISNRLVNLIALALIMGSANALTQYTMTGIPPDNIKDYFFPRTGRRNADDSEERLSFPTYWMDHYKLSAHPIQTVLHKIHPIFSMFLEALQNQDYFGVRIRDPDGTLLEQAEDVGKYLAQGFLPYTFTNAQKINDNNAGTGRQVASFFGVTPAPASVTRSEFQDFVAHNGTKGYDNAIKTPEEAARTKAKHSAEADIRSGKRPDLTGFTMRDRKDIIRLSRDPVPQIRFSKLSVDDKLRAYDMATPEERRRYHLREVILSHDPSKTNAWQTMSLDDRKAIVQRMREIAHEQPNAAR